MHNEWIQPAWRPQSVGAAMTTRDGGVSLPPYHGMNLGLRVGDDPSAVLRNRSSLAQAIRAHPVFLNQIHGTTVVRLHADAAQALPLGQDVIEADAAFTTDLGVACVVQVADCMPVLLAHEDGRVVGAAHAGWRGLAGGVLEQTVAAMCTAVGCQPHELHAWLGPCIGAAAFEVGADVLKAFEDQPRCFVEAPRADGSMRWRADLPALAAERLRRVGVAHQLASEACTVSDPRRFYSYRRDGTTGRHAAAVWRR